jgi:hypothetical protein
VAVFWGLGQGSFLLAGISLLTDGTRFSDFTPLSSSAPPTNEEAAPISFGNQDFEQQSIDLEGHTLCREIGLHPHC